MTRQFYIRITIVVFLLSLLHAKGQHDNERPSPEELHRMLKKKLADTVRIDAQIALAEYYRYSDPARAMKYCKSALYLAEKIKNPRSMAYVCFNIAVQYRREDKYAESIKHYYKALRLYEKLGKTLNVARIYGSAALVYWAQEKYPEALRDFRKSLKTGYTVGDSTIIYSNINNIGGVHLSVGHLDSAYIAFRQCYNHYVRLNDTLGLAESSGNLGDVLLQQNKDDEALKFYLESNRYGRLLDHKYVLLTSTGNMGQLYTKRKDYARALTMLKEALSLSIQLDAPMNRKDIYKDLATVYASLGDYNEAYRYRGLLIDLKDSLQRDKSDRQIDEIRVKYDSEKKDNLIRLNQAELRKKNEESKRKDAERNVLVVLIVLALLAVVAVLRGYRQKNRARRELENKNLIIEEKQKEILDSITYARRIQYTLLAHDSYLKQHLPEHFVLFKPKDIVSGDFYWATEKNSLQAGAPGGFYLAVCDSTGHGVPGAFMSLLNISFLNEAINEKGITAPGEVLNYVRTRLVQNMEGAQDGMDGALLRFEPGTCKIVYASAHRPLIRISNGVITELRYDKQPIGKSVKTADFSSYESPLQKGDMLYVYTDGFADQFGGPRGKKFKESNLRKLLQEIATRPLPDQQQHLESALEKWKGSLEQVDDICLVGIRIG